MVRTDDLNNANCFTHCNTCGFLVGKKHSFEFYLRRRLPPCRLSIISPRLPNVWTVTRRTVMGIKVALANAGNVDD